MAFRAGQGGVKELAPESQKDFDSEVFRAAGLRLGLGFLFSKAYSYRLIFIVLAFDEKQCFIPSYPD